MKWASVDDFGAKGDGLTDDTEAVQRAMNSGKPVVWFPKACYVINGTVAIPATVREVAFLWSSVYRTDPAQPTNLTAQQAGELLIKDEPAEAFKPALFRVAQSSDQPLLIHQGHHAGSVFLDHEAQRPVILEDMITWWIHTTTSHEAPACYSRARRHKRQVSRGCIGTQSRKGPPRRSLRTW
jgi:hypothetical protein